MKRTINLAAVLVVIISVYWSFKDSTPTYTQDHVVVSDTLFSVNNALYHLKNISKRPHFTGSKEHKLVQNYLFNELKKLGLTPEIQQQTAINKKWKAATTSENIIARIKGTNENSKALLLLSHYDSSPHSSNGASDAGSGIVTILESVRAFLAKNRKPANDIIILFSDAEELGLLGAQAFVKHHRWAKNIGLVLNFEARGSGGSSYMLLETNGKNKNLVTAFLEAGTNFPAASSLMYSVYKKLPNDTDLTVFREAGNINGFNFAFIDDHFDYHTQQDSFERLDRSSLLHQADYLTNTLNYFAYHDLSTLDSEEDLVFVNFPIAKMITYPFAWIFPMLVGAGILLMLLIVMGIQRRKLTIQGIGKGFIPFLIGLVLSAGACYLLWKLLLSVYPHYQDMLHGFTYNGHYYIAAFSFLSIWILLKVYAFFKEVMPLDLYIAPLIFSFLLNIFFAYYLPGAAFMIIPVFIALFILAIEIFRSIREKSKALLYAIISVPTVYIIAPMISLFPIALGLKMSFISAVFITLTFGLLIPVFVRHKEKSAWQIFTGILTLVFFGIAAFNSGFTKDNKKPNSLVYIQNEETNTAYFATYDNVLDAYTKQVFTTDYETGNIPETSGKSKYKTKYKYYKKTASRNIPSSAITILKDTVVQNTRNLKFLLAPKRNVRKYELYSASPVTISKLSINGESYENGASFEAKKGVLLSYQMANSDTGVAIEFSIAKDSPLNLSISETSYDLLTNPKFKLLPRKETMMPMPFVINDAIITSKKLPL